MCGPSGAGKSTLCDRILAAHGDLAYSISCTTRRPRGVEKDGKDYYFLSEQEFRRRVSEGLFLEHARVHGHSYGTLRETVRQELAAGKSVLMDIDIQGARQIRKALAAASAGDVMKQGFVDIFVKPPSLAVLRKRLESRAEDTPEAIKLRLKNAREELAARGEFKHLLVNDKLDKAFAELQALLDKEWGIG